MAAAKTVKTILPLIIALSASVTGVPSAAHARPNPDPIRFEQTQSKGEIRAMIRQEARQNGTVPEAIALAVAHVESRYNPQALSPKGARGIMQIMPATARGEFGVDPDWLWYPRINIRLGVQFLDDLYVRYGRRWDAALSHYNGGTLKGKGANARPHSYTREYVADVLAEARRIDPNYDTRGPSSRPGRSTSDAPIAMASATERTGRPLSLSPGGTRRSAFETDQSALSAPNVPVSGLEAPQAWAGDQGRDRCRAATSFSPRRCPGDVPSTAPVTVAFNTPVPANPAGPAFESPIESPRTDLPDAPVIGTPVTGAGTFAVEQDWSQEIASPSYETASAARPFADPQPERSDSLVPVTGEQDISPSAQLHASIGIARMRFRQSLSAFE